LGAYLVLALLRGLCLWVPSLEKGATGVGLILSGLASGMSLWLMYQLFGVWRLSCWWCVASALLFILIFLIHAALMQGLGGVFRRSWLDEVFFFFFLILAVGGAAVQYVGFKREAVQLEIRSMVAKVPPLKEVVGAPGYWIGDPRGRAVVVMMGDFYCASCRNAYKLVRGIQKAHPGLLKLYFCQLPMLEQRYSDVSFLASRVGVLAAGKGVFEGFAEKMMVATPSQVQSQEGVLRIAGSMGFREEEIKRIVGSGALEVEESIRRNQALAKRIGISMTPTFIFYGKGQKPRLATAASIEQLLQHLIQDS
jgi:hypothetical protein